jgi:hypothetical protein
VQLGVQYLPNQLIDVFYLAIHVLLKHSKTLGSVEDLESSDSPKELQ